MLMERKDMENNGRRMSGLKSSEGGRGNPEKASPAAVERYLKNIHFPVKRSELVNHAKQNGAPSDVMHVLGKFEDKSYQSVIDVSKEVGRVESMA